MYTEFWWWGLCHSFLHKFNSDPVKPILVCRSNHTAFRQAYQLQQWFSTELWNARFLWSDVSLTVMSLAPSARAPRIQLEDFVLCTACGASANERCSSPQAKRRTRFVSERILHAVCILCGPAWCSTLCPAPHYCAPCHEASSARPVGFARCSLAVIPRSPEHPRSIFQCDAAYRTMNRLAIHCTSVSAWCRKAKNSHIRTRGFQFHEESCSSSKHLQRDKHALLISLPRTKSS